MIVALLCAGAAALVLVTVGGAANGGNFILGQAKPATATTSLSGSTPGPQLKVVNTNTSNHTILAQAGGGSGIALYGQHTTAAGAGPAIRGDSASTAAGAFSLYGLLSSSAPGSSSAAIRAESKSTSANGYGLWASQAGTGVAVYGTSLSGTGVYGKHTGGVNSPTGPGVEGDSASAVSAGVIGKNTAGGPGLQAIVTNNTVAPLTVNSTAKVAGLNADLLDGLESTTLPYWKLGGNAGTSPGPHFVGTTDNKALELKVNGQRALRLEPDATSPNVIGGYSGNATEAGANGATIAGGGASANANVVSDNFGTVGGGKFNIAGDQDANGDPATTPFPTVAGGLLNTASGELSTVAGGYSNTASGQGSTVVGGYWNTAGNTGSLAAGTRAKANHYGTFVWGDATLADFASTGPNQFLVRAGGGAKFVRGASTFTPGPFATLQAENTTGFGEAGWLRLGDATNPTAVLSLVKQATGSGDFLECFDESSGPSYAQKCHINKDGTFVGGSDFAESLPARGGKARYSPGDVLSISTKHAGMVVKSQHARDRALIGVYSTRPAVLGADKGGIARVGKEDVPVAITGIVPVKATTEQGTIHPGDLLTSSSIPGRAMNAGRNPAVGTVLGKALGFLDHGQGMVRMLVMPR